MGAVTAPVQQTAPDLAALTSVLKARLRSLGHAPTSVDVYVEKAARDEGGSIRTHPDGTAFNSDYLTATIRLRSEPGRYFKAGEELGWRDGVEVVRWIAGLCVQTKERGGAWAISDGGLDERFQKTRPSAAYGWSYTLTPHIAAMTGRKF